MPTIFNWALIHLSPGVNAQLRWLAEGCVRHRPRGAKSQDRQELPIRFRVWRTAGIYLGVFAAFIVGLIALAQVGEIPQNAAEDPVLTGEFEIDGSSTVGPITLAVAEEFSKLHPNLQIPVGVSGTGGGFKRFVRGETLISNASRPIREIEVEAARERGIEYLEIPVAYDGLSVVVNPRNDFLNCLTTDELRRIWEPESAVKRWNDIRSDFPDKKIRLYGPGTDSGTFDYFTESIVGEGGASRPDYAASEDDNVLVQGIAGDRYSLGYFGYAYFAENRNLLGLVGIDSGPGCVEPSSETINDGSYAPLSREIFIYVNLEALERVEIRAFLDFYMTNAAVLVEEVGYVPLSPADYENNRALLGVGNEGSDRDGDNAGT